MAVDPIAARLDIARRCGASAGVDPTAPDAADGLANRRESVMDVLIRWEQ